MSLKVILGKLAFILRLFSNEQTLFTIALYSHLVLLKLHRLVNVKLKDLDKARESILLRTLKIKTFVKLDLGEQIVNVFGLVVELVCIPFAKDAVLIVHHFLTLVE